MVGGMTDLDNARLRHSEIIHTIRQHYTGIDEGFTELRALNREIAKLGGWQIEIIDKGSAMETECDLGISDDCHEFERPGYPMITVKGTEDWVCDNCAELIQPGIPQRRKELEEEAYSDE